MEIRRSRLSDYFLVVLFYNIFSVRDDVLKIKHINNNKTDIDTPASSDKEKLTNLSKRNFQEFRLP